MSFFDEMKALADEFTTGELFSPAVITRAQPTFNPVAGTVAGTSTIINCRAVIQKIMTKAANGALVSNTMVILDKEPKAGDVIQINGQAQTYKVGDVITIAPDNVTKMIFKAMIVK